MHHNRALALLIALMLLAACQSTPVTSGGKEVTNQTIATATRAVHIAELAATTVADTLSTEFKAGRVRRETLEAFQSQIAPKVSAALATARQALLAFQQAPETTPLVTVLHAVMALQAEVATLQGFWAANIPTSGGVR